MLWHDKQTRPGQESLFVADAMLSANYNGTATIQGRLVV